MVVAPVSFEYIFDSMETSRHVNRPGHYADTLTVCLSPEQVATTNVAEPALGTGGRSVPVQANLCDQLKSFSLHPGCRNMVTTGLATLGTKAVNDIANFTTQSITHTTTQATTLVNLLAPVH